MTFLHVEWLGSTLEGEFTHQEGARKGTVEVVWASTQDTSWAPSFRGLPGMPKREETPG